MLAPPEQLMSPPVSEAADAVLSFFAYANCYPYGVNNEVSETTGSSGGFKALNKFMCMSKTFVYLVRACLR